MSDSWESRMAEKRKKPEPPKPTDEPECCYEWRLDGETWRQFRVCASNDCDHRHHDEEIWYALGAHVRGRQKKGPH